MNSFRQHTQLLSHLNIRPYWCPLAEEIRLETLWSPDYAGFPYNQGVPVYSRENMLEISVKTCLKVTGTPVKICWDFGCRDYSKSELFEVRSPPRKDRALVWYTYTLHTVVCICECAQKTQSFERGSLWENTYTSLQKTALCICQKSPVNMSKEPCIRQNSLVYMSKEPCIYDVSLVCARVTYIHNSFVMCIVLLWLIHVHGFLVIYLGLLWHIYLQKNLRFIWHESGTCSCETCIHGSCVFF